MGDIDDFPISIEVSRKYNWIYIISHSGILHIYDLKKIVLIFRGKISDDPIISTTEFSGGFNFLTEKEQLFSCVMDENKIVMHISLEMKDEQFALDVAALANLSEIEDLARLQTTIVNVVICPDHVPSAQWKLMLGSWMS